MVGRDATEPSADPSGGGGQRECTRSCDRCSQEVTVTARPIQPIPLLCTRALRPQLREQGRQDCAYPRTEVAVKAALAKVAQGRGVTLMVNRFGSVFPNSVANQGPRLPIAGGIVVL